MADTIWDAPLSRNQAAALVAAELEDLQARLLPRLHGLCGYLDVSVDAAIEGVMDKLWSYVKEEYQ